MDKLSLEPTLPDSPTYLSFLPHHVLLEICSYLDQETLWHVMWTCQALRAAGERALRHHLVDLVVASNPPRATNIFDAIDPAVAKGTEAEYDTLFRLSQKAEWALIEYAPAGELLRNLTVEIWSNTELYTYDILSGYAAQLERVEIHFLDAFAQDPFVPEEDEDGIMDYGDLWEDAPIAWGPWISPGDIHFPHLTHLTLIATARTFPHFCILADHLPNLVELQLSAHRRDNLDPDFDVNDNPVFDEFPNLQTLWVAGDGVSVSEILHSIIPRSRHNIHYLVLHTHTPPYSFDSLEPLLAGAIVVCDQLRGLGLYGAVATSVLQCICNTQSATSTEPRESQGASQPGLFFPHLTALALEKDDDGFAMLNEGPDEWPNFPALSQITYIDRESDSRGGSVLDTSLRNESAYENFVLICQFLFIETLFSVQFIHTYPLEPFRPHTAPSEEIKEHGVMQCIRVSWWGSGNRAVLDSFAQWGTRRVIGDEYERDLV